MGSLLELKTRQHWWAKILLNIKAKILRVSERQFKPGVQASKILSFIADAIPSVVQTVEVWRNSSYKQCTCVNVYMCVWCIYMCTYIHILYRDEAIFYIFVSTLIFYDMLM